MKNEQKGKKSNPWQHNDDVIVGSEDFTLSTLVRELVKKHLEEMIPTNDIMSPEIEKKYAEDRKKIKGEVPPR